MRVARAAAPLLLALALALPGLATGARAQPVFYEQDGIVVVEAESARASGWGERTEHAGYTGRCYYVNTGGGTLTYRIVITSTGEYRLAIRNRHEHEDSTLENDCWTSMDGGRRIKTYSSKAHEWTWHTRHEFTKSDHRDPVYELAPGTHTFEVSGRSRNFMIDRFHLYLETVKNPLDEARRESGGAPEMPELTELRQVEWYLKSGMLGAALAYAEKRLDSSRPAEAAEAKEAARRLAEYARERRGRIERVKATAPAAAVDLLADLARRFGPSNLGKELMAEARRWSKEPATVKDRKARMILASVEQAAKKLDGKGTAANPKVARRYGREILVIAAGVRMLRAKFPGTPACTRATSIARGLGIPVE